MRDYDELTLLSVEDLAQLLRTTPRGIQARRQRGDLPPACQVKPLGWRRKDYAAWLEEKVEQDRARQIRRQNGVGRSGK